jgi:hypothetical protein
MYQGGSFLCSFPFCLLTVEDVSKLVVGSVLCVSISDGSSTKPSAGLTINNVPSNAFIFVCISSLGIVTWQQTDNSVGQLKQCVMAKIISEAHFI